MFHELQLIFVKYNFNRFIIGEALCPSLIVFRAKIGKSTAEAYELQVKAMGDDNFTRYKITEEIGKGQIKIIPDLVINGGTDGGSDSSLNGLLGLKLLELNGPARTERAVNPPERNGQ